MKYIDPWWYIRYSVNGYQGCEHACVYCDARSERYHIAGGFDQTIIVKKNVKEQLDRRLFKARTFIPDVTTLGGVNDCYMPTEREFKNTRQILEVLLKHKFPVSISTKSTLVLRDLDLFQHISEEAWCAIAFTITSVDEEISSFLEPYAASSEERFLALERIKQKDPRIQTGINFMPIVPFLEDTDENMEAVVRRAHEMKVDNITFAGMTLRDQQALYFFRKLGEKYPDLVEKFHTLYQGNYVPKDKDYMASISKKMVQLCKKYSVKYRVKRWIPSDFRRVNYLIAQDLADYAYELQIQGKPKRAYNKWLWTAHYINNLPESITNIAQRNQLETIQNVQGEIQQEVERLIKKYGRAKKLEQYFH